MRVAVIALSIVPVLLSPSPAAAQRLASFQDVALRINLEDQLRVESASGATVTGRLTHLTREDLTIQTDRGETRFTGDSIRVVAVRGHALRKGAVIGAGVFAVLGAVATCAHEGGASCGILGLGAAPIGAGIGLTLGALIPQMRTVYRAAESDASVSRSEAAIGDQATLLEDLALRVNLDDQLRIEDPSGIMTSGRLTHLTSDEIAIQTLVGEKRFTRQTVRQVAVRRSPLRMGVLIGAGVSSAMGALAGCAGPTREECADAPIMAAALGAGAGLAVGALIHRTTIVFPTPERRTSLSPVVALGAVGVRAHLRW